MKHNNKQYYCLYLKNNIKDMKNTWNEIKSIIFLKTSESKSLKAILNSRDEFLTNPRDIANSFINFCFSVAPNIQSTIKQTL